MIFLSFILGIVVGVALAFTVLAMTARGFTE